MAYRKVNKKCAGCGVEFLANGGHIRYCSKRCSKLVDLNPAWRGEDVSIKNLHKWVERHLGRPDRCDKCGKVGKVDLANKSNEYKRDLDDWDWLCRKCHMESDGRMAKFLVHSNMHNRIPEKPCLQCGKHFKPWNSKSIYCSVSCRSTYINLNKKDYSKNWETRRRKNA